MIVRGSISTARSRKPGQNTVLAVISGGDTGGNNDYTRVGRIETQECGKLALSESPNKDQSMDDYMASIEPGGYYKVYMTNVQLNSPGLTSVTRLEKAERPS